MSQQRGKKEKARPFKFGRYGFVSDRGLNPRRVTNEDSLLLMEKIPLFAVADGVGGQNAGEVASQVAVEILKHYFSNETVPEDKESFLNQVIRHANRYLHDMGLDDELLSGMATTLAVIVVEKRQAILSHVGDSRIYRFTAGQLFRETTDHTIGQDHDSGEGEKPSGSKGVITRALGIDRDVEPESKRLPIPPDTTFLLCTDGITRHLRDQELADILRRESDPQAVCDALKEICYERGAKDNFTAIVVTLDGLSKSMGLFDRRRAGHSFPPERERPANVARIQIPIAHHDQRRAERGRAAAGHDSISAREETLSGDVDRGLERAGAPLPRRRRLVNALLVSVAVGASFLSGVYLGRERAPSFLAGVMESSQTPAPDGFRQGREAFEAGDYPTARQAFTEAMKMGPDTASYSHWLGKTQLAMGDYRQAAESFYQAASLGGPPENYLFAAAAYQALGEREKVTDAIRAYLVATGRQPVPPK